MKNNELLELFIEEQSNDKSENTANAYKSDAKQFIKIITKDLLILNQSDIDEYKEALIKTINGRTKKPITPVTINRKLVSIRKLIKFINNSEIINENIDVNIELIKIQKSEHLQEMLSKNDYDRIINIARKHNDIRAVAIFETLFKTGVRVSELLQIKVNDVFSGDIFIKGKGEKYREIMFSPSLIDIIEEYTNEYKLEKTDFLFPGKNKNKSITRQTIHSIIKKHAGKARIKLTKAHAHNFRHLFCLRLIEEGVTIDEVADLAGHSDINTTRIYTRKTKKELKKTISRL